MKFDDDEESVVPRSVAVCFCRYDGEGAIMMCVRR